MNEHGTFMWNYLVTEDQKSSGDFYCKLFGWEKIEVNAGAVRHIYYFQA